MTSRPGSRSSRPGGSRRPNATARIRTTAVTERTRPAFTGRALVLLLVGVLLAASYTSMLHTWWGQRQEVQATRAEIAERREAIDRLENTKRRFDDPAFIESLARRRFGWVMPGEVGYRVIGIDGRIQGEIPAPPTLATERKIHWYDVVWSSVQGAGRDPKDQPPPTNPDKVLRE